MSDLLDRIDLRFDLIKERLSHYEISDTGCWVFTGAKHSNGYGRFSIYVNSFKPQKRHFVASRVAFAFFNGVDPGAQLVCHTCDNPPCINPDHLFLGTPRDNAQDMISKGRGAPQQGCNNHAAKLTESLVLDVIQAIKSGKNNKQIAAEFAVGHAQISLIRLGKSWRHITQAANYDPDEYRTFKRRVG